jgi:hypothetical protein
MDVDGDGVALTTKDSLIMTRVALGMTEEAVVTGIDFAAHASRKTWAALRDYLTGNCGMKLR